MSSNQPSIVRRNSVMSSRAPSSGRASRGDEKDSTAIHRGRTLKVVQDPVHAQRVQPDLQQNPIAENGVPMAARSAAHATTAPPRSTADLLASARAQNIGMASLRGGGAAAALSMSRNPSGWVKWNGAARPSARMLARKLALNALAGNAGDSDDVNDDNALCMCLPFERRTGDNPQDPHTRDEVLALIRQWAEQASQGTGDGQFDQFLDDLVAGSTLDEQETRKLADELRHPNGKEDAAIMAALRKLTAVPRLFGEANRKTREAIRARLDNEDQEHTHDGNLGSLASTEFNISLAFAGMSEADKLIKLVAELVVNEVNVHHFGESVLSAMQVRTLMKEGGLMRLVRALSDEITAATNQRNMRWLHEAVHKFGHVKIMVTLIEFCTRLSEQMARLETPSHAAAR